MTLHKWGGKSRCYRHARRKRSTPWLPISRLRFVLWEHTSQHTPVRLPHTHTHTCKSCFSAGVMMYTRRNGRRKRRHGWERQRCPAIVSGWRPDSTERGHRSGSLVCAPALRKHSIRVTRSFPFTLTYVHYPCKHAKDMRVCMQEPAGLQLTIILITD